MPIILLFFRSAHAFAPPPRCTARAGRRRAGLARCGLLLYDDVWKNERSQQLACCLLL